MPSGPEPAPALRQRLKDEPGCTVDVVATPDGPAVEKTYRNRGLRWLQSFGRRSRAQREHANLEAASRLGLRCTPPLAWRERRRLGCVDHSTVVTALVSDADSLKSVLKGAGWHERRRLCAALGAMLRRLHEKGFLWNAPMPRNVLVVGDPGAADLVLCDAPNAIVFPRTLLGRNSAAIDLFRAAFSPSRRREFSRGERWRILLAYTAGDRVEARRLWRRLRRRTLIGNDLRRALAAVFLVYFG